MENKEEVLEESKEPTKNEKIKNSVVSIAIIVVGVIMYKYHWNIIEKERIK